MFMSDNMYVLSTKILVQDEKAEKEQIRWQYLAL